MSSDVAAARPRANRSLRAEGTSPSGAQPAAKRATPTDLDASAAEPPVKSSGPSAKSPRPPARSSRPSAKSSAAVAEPIGAVAKSSVPLNRSTASLSKSVRPEGDSRLDVDPANFPVETCAPVTGRRKKAAVRVSARQRLASLGVKLRALASVASAIAVIVGVALAGREGHRWLISTDRFNAREVIVTGVDHTSRAEVLHAAGITPERNVLSIDCEVAAKAIETLPWVSRARVTRRLPGHVEVTVEERAAVALVSAGGMYLVAGDGTLFKRAVPSDPSDLPVITGVDRNEFERDPAGAREAVRDALALLADVEASAVGAPMRVDEVHCEPTGDLSIVVGGAHVWLGRGPYRAKLTRLRVVLRELERRTLRASEIHLESDRHPERVTVRMASSAR